MYDSRTLDCAATSEIDWYFGLRYTQIESNTASDVSEVALGAHNLDDDEI